MTLLAFGCSFLATHSVVRVLVASISASAMILVIAYRISIRKHKDRLLAPRRALDRIMHRNVTLAMAAVVGVEVLSSYVGPESDSIPFVLRVVIGAVTAVSGVVVLSSLVDWFYVMPRVSGLTGVAPCRVGGNGMAFAALTKVWFFHRGVTALCVSFVGGGVAAFLVPSIESPGVAAGVSVGGSLLTIVLAEFNGHPIHVLIKSWLTPETTVGAVTAVRAGYDTNQVRDAYIVDASVHGYKFRFLDEETKADARFRSKGEELSFEEADKALTSERQTAACPSVHECQAVNWYCFRNPLANDPIPKTEDELQTKPFPLEFDGA